MSQAGSGISNAMEKSVGGRTKKWIDGQRAAQKEWKARDASKRLATGEYAAHGRFGSLLNRAGVVTARKGMDRLITGTTPVTETNRRKFEKIQEQAEAYRAEDLKKETARLTADLEAYDKGDHDAIRRAIMLKKKIKVNTIDGQETEFDGAAHLAAQKPELRHLRVDAAASMAAQFGGEQHMKAIDEWYRQVEDNGSVEEKREMQRYLQHNVGQLFGKMPHLYKGAGGAATEPPETIAGMAGSTVETIIADLEAEMNRTTLKDGETMDQLASKRASAASALNTFLHNYTEAAANENLRGKLNPNGLKAVRAFIDGQKPGSQLPAINRARRINTSADPTPIFEKLNLIEPAEALVVTDDQGNAHTVIPPDMVERVESLINRDGSINRNPQSSPVPPGTHDPIADETEVNITHDTPPGPSNPTISTPSDPGFQNPNSSDLPRG